MAFFFSALFLFGILSGHGSEQSCLPFCDGPECITVNQLSVDFKTAEEMCQRRNGELLTLQSESSQHCFAALTEALPKSFWIGLQLPAGTCSDPSAPLRGYEWTSGSPNGTFSPPAGSWSEDLQLCAPSCVSLSDCGNWTERPCSDRTDGFLCRTRARDACWEHEVIFKGPKGCLAGPCQQNCENVDGGYKCFCDKGYMVDSRKPDHCTPHCAEQNCPALCPDDGCYCPEGFILDGDVCEDINECEMGECGGGCVNTYGSFLCVCSAFQNKAQPACTKTFHSSTPLSKDQILKSSTAPSGSFIWVWVVGTVMLVALLVLIRVYVVKRNK